MLGFAAILKSSTPILLLPSRISLFPCRIRSFPSRILNFRSGSTVRRKRFEVSAEEKNGRNGSKEELEGEGEELKKKMEKNGGGRRLNGWWGDLLDPDPDNIVAVGLTGVLAWASAQVLWQLFFISFAILVAALKYSFVAALLLFILITLL